MHAGMGWNRQLPVPALVRTLHINRTGIFETDSRDFNITPSFLTEPTIHPQPRNRESQLRPLVVSCHQEDCFRLHYSSSRVHVR